MSESEQRDETGINDEYQPIVAQVALVLSTRRLVINRGADDGVVVGDIFAISDPKPEPVKDPETGKVIGSIHLEKLRVKVIEVQEHIATAITYRKVTVGGAFASSGGLFAPPREETEKIRASNDAMAKSADSLVKIGDVAKEILEG